MEVREESAYFRGGGGDALERIKESEVLVHCEVRVETRLGRTDTNKFLDFKGF